MKEKSLYLFALFLPLEQLLLYVFGIDTELKPYRVFLILAFILTFLDNSFLKYKFTLEFKSFLFIFMYGFIIGMARISIDKGEMSYLTNGATHFLIGLMILYLFSNISNKNLLYKIGNYFIVGVLISSLYGLYIFIFNPYQSQGFRLRGFFNNPNHLAFAINFLMPFLFYKYKNEKSRGKNILLIFFLTLIVIMTGSRTGVIIQIISILFFLFFMRKNIVNFIVVGSIGILSYLTIFKTLFGLNEGVMGRFEKSNYETGSGRFDIIDSVIKLGYDTNFLGVGIGQYRFYHLKYIGSNSYQTVQEFSLGTHNHYLDLLVNFGFLSFIVYIFILLRIKWNISNKMSGDKNKLVYLFFISILISSLSQEMLIFPIFWLSFSLLIVFTFNKNNGYYSK